MQTPCIRVQANTAWLEQVLCQMHGRLHISQAYLTEVHREFIHLLETDLSAGVPTSIMHILRLAVDSIDTGYMLVT